MELTGLVGASFTRAARAPRARDVVGRLVDVVGEVIRGGERAETREDF